MLTPFSRSLSLENIASPEVSILLTELHTTNKLRNGFFAVGKFNHFYFQVIGISEENIFINANEHKVWVCFNLIAFL